MRTCLRILCAAAIAASLGTGRAEADLTITPLTPAFATGPETSQAQINVILDGLIGNSTELYKSDEETGTVSGPFASSYTTTYSNPVGDPGNALIEYVSGPKLTTANYLLVKDGNQDPAWYLFAINWDGMMDISIEDFWPGNGAISHVALYQGDPFNTVPEPTTFALWGVAGIAGLVARRRRKTNA
ncbi:PEP-CTERM sorting domain-containing protein [Thalassoglobus sp. JC818]|uniref:PEP-CTERM sorting domain-containing protein n=1 Tax=Thalassoglobus sp. JC818 TaxID=3232136 RepID=UPI003458F6E0